MSGNESAYAVWEALYASGHRQRYPWDMVVSFVYRHAPRDRHRADIHILEVGCGAGANLWFAAREGFSVAGVDLSETAIAAAKARLAEEGLSGDLRVGDFRSLPFADDSFDLVIDRGALTCCGTSVLRAAFDEIARTIREDGLFLFTPYSDLDSSRISGKSGPDDVVEGIETGPLVGRGPIRFASRQEIERLASTDWRIEALDHTEVANVLDTGHLVHAEWRAILRRTGKTPPR